MNGAKLKAAFTAITNGYPIEEVSECLDWRDFEGLVSQILLENGFEVEKKEFGNCFGTEEFIEGIRAFMEKRKPNF